VDWLVAQHDDDEGDGEGEDSVDEDEELGVSEASRLTGRVHIVLGHGGSGSIQKTNYPSLAEVEGPQREGDGGQERYYGTTFCSTTVSVYGSLFLSPCGIYFQP
jgi:hypothetical protein